MRAVPEITHHLVKCCGASPSQISGDLDQLADIGHSLRTVLMGHQDNVEICLSDDVLQDFGGCGGVSPFDPVLQKFLELRPTRAKARDYMRALQQGLKRKPE